MELHRAWKYELDPNDRTRTLLHKHAGVARFAWNWSLARRIERFKTGVDKEKFTTDFAESRALNALKATELPWMYEVSAFAPLIALQHLDDAFKLFWKGRKQGVGFPRFKKKGVARDSFGLGNESVKVLPHHVQLPRLGRIRLKQTTERFSGRILSATVSRTADRWFVSISTVEEVPDPVPVQGPVVGIDLGLTAFATLSDGTKIQAPKPLKHALDRLKRAQRVHSRKVKGSQNRRKSALKVARIHAHVANVRNDFLHKLTTDLAKTKSIIVMEDLHVQGMLKNRSLARSISDVGWGEFKRQLSYKTVWYGSQLVLADRWFASSKICSACGDKIDKMPLSVREWTCPSCGVVHDRDINAAQNLAKLAYREDPGNLTPVETVSPAERSDAVYEGPVVEAGITPRVISDQL